MTSALLALTLTQLATKKAGWWDINVRYPRFAAGGAVARAANAAATARERQEFAAFLAQAKADMPEVKRNGGPGSYSLDMTAHRIADRPGLASGYVERYDYLAGAHGSTRYESLNFGLVRGRVRELTLSDLFRPDADAVGQCSRALVAILKAEKEAPSSVVSGDWKGLTPEQARRFAVGKLGILFLFGSYELGAYVEGTRQTLVPWSRLKGVDRKDVLAPLFR